MQVVSAPVAHGGREGGRLTAPTLQCGPTAAGNQFHCSRRSKERGNQPTNQPTHQPTNPVSSSQTNGDKKKKRRILFTSMFISTSFSTHVLKWRTEEKQSWFCTSFPAGMRRAGSQGK